MRYNEQQRTVQDYCQTTISGLHSCHNYSIEHLKFVHVFHFEERQTQWGNRKMWQSKHNLRVGMPCSGWQK
jgi:uncharacterized protein (DUF1919 family)